MNKVVYLNLSPDQPPSFEAIESLRQQAAAHFDALVSKLGFLDKQGNPVTIAFSVEAMNPKAKYFYNGCASRAGDASYEIVFGGGLLARLEVLSRALTVNKKALKGSTSTRLIAKGVRRDGRQKAMSNFAFHYMLNLILWHEVAHVALGHVDWLAKEFGALEYVEMPMHPVSPEEADARRVLEGDADRQAALWSVSLYDHTLEHNEFLRYTTKADAFYDFGYLVGAMFSMSEALSDVASNQLKTHPEPQQRIGVMLAFAEEYLQKKYPEAFQVLHQCCVRGAIQALHDIVHQNRKPLDVWGIVSFLAQNGTKIDELGVRNLQLVPNAGLCSFDLSMV